MAAIVTFTAHNLTYLSTVGKLVGLALLLGSAVIVWLRLGVHKTIAAVMSGLTAQLLIGVWLAAAGQLYQAPGGLQDLLIIWAVLGAPFALASKHAAHWAGWLAIILGISLTPNGTYFHAWFGYINFELKVMIWAVIFSAVAGLLLWRKTAVWLFTAAALIASGWLTAAIIIGIADVVYFGGFILAGLIASGFAALLYRQKKALAALCLFTVTALSAPVSFVSRGVIEIVQGFGYGLFLILALILGGATFFMILLFNHYRTHFADHEETDIRADGIAKQADKTPWYMDVLIAIGGILTAIFSTAFLGLFIAAIISSSQHRDFLIFMIGLVLYAVFLVLRLKQSHRQHNVPLLTCFSIGLALPVLWFVPQRVMEVIQSLIIASSVFYFFYEGVNLGTIWTEPLLVLTLAGLAGLCFFGQTNGRWRLAAAIIFLLAAIYAGVNNIKYLRETQGLLDGGSKAFLPMILRATSFAIALIAIQFTRLKSTLPSLPILAAIILIVGLLPGGAFGAALILLIGYAAGLRSYFTIGSVAALYFLFAAYYDLRLTLMELSGVLAFSGLIFLGIWHVSRLQKLAHGKSALLGWALRCAYINLSRAQWQRKTFVKMVNAF